MTSSIRNESLSIEFEEQRTLEFDSARSEEDSFEGETSKIAQTRRSEDDTQQSAVDDNSVGNNRESEDDPLGVFGKYLSLWVFLCMVLGTLIGYFAPIVPQTLAKATFYQIDAPTAILIWLMIFPMMMQVRMSAILDVRKKIGGVVVCTVMNWAVQPFIMYGLALLFFQIAYSTLLDTATQDQYIAGSVLLGGSPCTAMVFVWSKLAGGDAAYTIVQVAVNDAILLFAYVPIVVGLLSLSSIEMPWGTVIVSVVVFVVTPFIAGALTRHFVIRRHGEATFARVTSVFNYVTMAALLLTLVIIFIFQGATIVERWFHILLIAVPLTLQTFISFGMAYGACYLFGLPYDIAAPAGFIGSSNFFELAVSVAITVYGPQSGAAAATVVGVLTEVPTMLLLVWFAKRTRAAVQRRAASAPMRRFASILGRHTDAMLTSTLLLPDLAAFANEFHEDVQRATSIDSERRSRLFSVRDCVLSAIRSDNENADHVARLLFLCTHNSRRSQLAQVWYSVAATFYGLAGKVEAYSAGTVATSLHPAIIHTLREFGFRVTSEQNDRQHTYLVLYSQDAAPLRLFSKALADVKPEDSEFKSRRCIVAVCSDADQQCPLGGKCRCRIALPYEDPKVADGRDDEAQTYFDRSREIALEAFFVMLCVARALRSSDK